MDKFIVKNLTESQKALRRRILELSHASSRAHIGSCLTAVDLIDAVYQTKKKHEKFILSNGHAGIAWYSVLEKYGYFQNLLTIKKLRTHPDRNATHGIHVSTGSLGQGLPIALGMALAQRKDQVYCMISDGECAEGSVWESLRVAWETRTTNLTIIINANGWAAYDKVNLSLLAKRIRGFGYAIQKINGHDMQQIFSALHKKNMSELRVIIAYTQVEQFPFLRGQDAHYYIMRKKDFETAMQLLQ